MLRRLAATLDQRIGHRADAKRAHGASWHLHRYTRSGDDPFSGSSLYRCRCGVVRPAL